MRRLPAITIPPVTLPVGRKKRAALFAAPFLLAALLLYLYGIPYLLKREIDTVLSYQGISGITYNSFDRRRGEIMLSGIKLDRAGFSQIETLRARIDWPALLTGRDLFSEMIIDGLHLTGEIDDDGTVTVAGWSPRAFFTLAGARNIVANSIRFDLSAPSGGLRFEAKGRLVAQPDGSRRLEAALWSRQHQMTLDTRWDGVLKPDGQWTAAADIREARLSFPRLSASRVTGWLSFEGEGDSTPAVSGQIAAGLIKPGDGFSGLNDFTATIDGKLDSYRLILSGDAANYEGLELSADLLTGRDAALTLTIEGRQIDYLLAYADSLNRDMQAFSGRAAGFTSLLLTPGNMNRLKRQLAQTPYDVLRLTADGTPYDLTGKITATRYVNGIPQNSVISINPGR